MPQKKANQIDAAHTQTIEIHFDPSRIQDPISIAPDQIELRDEDTGIEFVLRTVGGSRRQARFPKTAFITWVEGIPADASAARFDNGRTRVRLPLLARNEGDEELRFPYHLSARYKDTVYTSGGYPAVCDPPPCVG